MNGYTLLDQFPPTSEIEWLCVDVVVVVVWRAFTPGQTQTELGPRGLSFYYPRLLHCLDEMLAVMLLSQHRVSSSKTVRPRAPCGARCIRHTVSTWSAVCSEAPHSQFGEGARPHLCMDKWNRPTPVRRRLSLTQVARGKPIPTGLALIPGTKARSQEALSQYSAFHLWSWRSQHRPSLITPIMFALSVPSIPVKRWNFRKAKWSHYIALTN